MPPWTINTMLITIAIGYAFGCLQFSYIIGKTLKKVDIRSLGNGNAGASNTVTTFGWKYGVAVGILDILKAVFSLLIIKILYGGAITNDQLTFLLYLNGLFVIIGHNFPFFMGFKGGKGTASLIGMLFVIDLRIGLLGALTILIVTLVTDYIALGTICLVTGFVASTFYFGYSQGSIVIAIIIAVMSIYKHIPNIKNIRKGTEKGLRRTIKKV